MELTWIKECFKFPRWLSTGAYILTSTHTIAKPVHSPKYQRKDPTVEVRRGLTPSGPLI